MPKAAPELQFATSYSLKVQRPDFLRGPGAQLAGVVHLQVTLDHGRRLPHAQPMEEARRRPRLRRGRNGGVRPAVRSPPIFGVMKDGRRGRRRRGRGGRPRGCLLVDRQEHAVPAAPASAPLDRVAPYEVGEAFLWSVHQSTSVSPAYT